MGKQHHYATTVRWTGNLGPGTTGYKDYSRDHDISGPGKPVVAGSADPAFRGDPSRYNPEDVLVASLSACHMLCYLSLAAANKIIVVDYVDEAEGTMEEAATVGGRFTEVTLRPVVTVMPGADLKLAEELHHKAHEKCFIAASVNFPVKCEPQFLLKS